MEEGAGKRCSECGIGLHTLSPHLEIVGAVLTLDRKLVPLVLGQAVVSVPGVATRGPGQDGGQRVDEVIHCPGQHHDVVGVEPRSHDRGRVPHTCNEHTHITTQAQVQRHRTQSGTDRQTETERERETDRQTHAGTHTQTRTRTRTRTHTHTHTHTHT